MPADHDHDAGGSAAAAGSASQRLTNDDFRKLLMTPRTGAAGSAGHAPGSIREAMANGSGAAGALAGKAMPPPSERNEARRKKKNFYAALKKQEDTKMQELADKYRDRARERRDDANPDYSAEVAAAGTANTASSAYRAVAPDLKSGQDAAERRRRMIQESKFLGGDMEHTHLVKGLDYALLQKVRSEIVVKEQEQEIEMEKLAEEAEEKEKLAAEAELAAAAGAPDDEPAYRSLLGRNVLNSIAFYRSRHVERNELFAPGRMAYVIEMDDEVAAETGDIPTTLIRSKADVPETLGEMQTLSTNDIVINKLAQILSYLRQGARGKKNKKRDKDKLLTMDDDQELGYVRRSANGAPASGSAVSSGGKRHEAEAQRSQRPKDDVSIYDDLGDYRPSTSRAGGSSYGQDGRQYFDKSSEQEEREAGGLTLPPPPKISASHLITKLADEPEGYAECYPGLQEMNDAIDDSDDEVDYTKMDLGNKKGPVGRWDFDTEEAYSDYMSNKEALPKAAFQYGVKMQDGRKTRKHKTEKNEKAELDREWNKIQNIMNKRKSKGGGDGEPESKSSRH